MIRCGIVLPGQRSSLVYARNPKVRPDCDSNAEGEIRTPEGLAAHQISSLARSTGLRYLSGLASSEARNTFSPRSLGGKQRRRIEFDRDDRLHQAVCVKDPRMDLPESTEVATPRPHRAARPAMKVSSSTAS